MHRNPNRHIKRNENQCSRNAWDDSILAADSTGTPLRYPMMISLKVLKVNHAIGADLRIAATVLGTRESATGARFNAFSSVCKLSSPDSSG